MRLDGGRGDGFSPFPSCDIISAFKPEFPTTEAKGTFEKAYGDENIAISLLFFPFGSITIIQESCLEFVYRFIKTIIFIIKFIL